MVDTTKLIKKLSGAPKYGSRILCKPSEPLISHKINGIKIYVDNSKYFFKYPEDDDIYICIGEVGVCDEQELAENFEQEYKNTKTWYNIASYKTYTKGNLLSILITVERKNI